MEDQRDNISLVLAAFDALFNQRDYAKSERYWSPRYIQHSPDVAPGRDGLISLVKAAPLSMRYENQFATANDSIVMLYGRFSGRGPGLANCIAADVVRVEHGVLVEHWSIKADEVSQSVSKSGHPMFGETFPSD